MKARKSPGAVAALGASETDELGRHVVSEANRQQQLAQAPICATLTGSDRSEPESVIARGPAPVLAICRALIEAGHEPERMLHAYRGGVLAVKVRSLGEGARLNVEDDRHGTPRLRRWRHGPRGCGADSPVAQIANGRGVASKVQQATRGCCGRTMTRHELQTRRLS
jgi:hypothetical protein